MIRAVPIIVCLCAALLWLDQPATSLGATSTSNLPGGPYFVALNWKPSPDTNVVGYFLYWGVASGLCTNRQNAGNTNRVTFGGLQTNVIYYFQVSAYDRAGQESLPSNEIQYSIPAGQLNPPPPCLIQMARKADGTLMLTWPATSGLSYRIQYCSNLAQAGWTDLTPPITATNTLLSFCDPLGPAPQRFYRILTPP